MNSNQVATELSCLVCNEVTEHVVEYLDGSIKNIICSQCGLKIELIIEISFCHYPEELLHRVITKPGRILEETRNGLVKFLHTMPVRIATKPYRLNKEIVLRQVKRTFSAQKTAELFCCVCAETTSHTLRYYHEKIQSSVCKQCGLEMELLSVVINFCHYPEELAYRLLTKPHRLLEEIHNHRKRFLWTIPIRVTTKPYRITKEISAKLKR